LGTNRELVVNLSLVTKHFLKAIKVFPNFFKTYFLFFFVETLQIKVTVWLFITWTIVICSTWMSDHAAFGFDLCINY